MNELKKSNRDSKSWMFNRSSLLEALIRLRKERGALPVETALTTPAYYCAHHHRSTSHYPATGGSVMMFDSWVSASTLPWFLFSRGVVRMRIQTMVKTGLSPSFQLKVMFCFIHLFHIFPQHAHSIMSTFTVSPWSEYICTPAKKQLFASKHTSKVQSSAQSVYSLLPTNLRDSECVPAWSSPENFYKLPQKLTTMLRRLVGVIPVLTWSTPFFIRSEDDL